MRVFVNVSTVTADTTFTLCGLRSGVAQVMIARCHTAVRSFIRAGVLCAIVFAIACAVRLWAQGPATHPSIWLRRLPPVDASVAYDSAPESQIVRQDRADEGQGWPVRISGYSDADTGPIPVAIDPGVDLIDPHESQESEQHGQRPQSTTTEIWMSGSGVTLWRHVPQRRGLDHAGDAEFARSMFEVARRHYTKGDRDTAEWLAQHAQQLLNDRIGAAAFTEFRGFGKTVAAEPAEANLLADRPGSPRVPTAFYVAAAPSAIRRNESSTVNFESILPVKNGIPAPFPSDRLPTMSGHEALPTDDNHEPDVDGARPRATSLVEQEPRDRAPTLSLVAVGGTDRLPPVASTDSSVIVVVSFTGGMVFSAVFCMLLLLFRYRTNLVLPMGLIPPASTPGTVHVDSVG